MKRAMEEGTSIAKVAISIIVKHVALIASISAIILSVGSVRIASDKAG